MSDPADRSAAVRRQDDLPGPPPGAAEALGAALEPIARFGALIAHQGVERGLVGPREVPILWERHLLNSAAVAPLLPETGRLVDVGSGAGFPGVVLAAMRPDLEVVLLEPMERRTQWLTEVSAELGLGNVTVLRGRAEEQHGRLYADAVTARAVAPMDRLAGWTIPLLRHGGCLLALKGSRAAAELEDAAAALTALGADTGQVLEVACPPGAAPTRVVRVCRSAPEVPRKATERSGVGRDDGGPAGGGPGGSGLRRRQKGRGGARRTGR